MRRASRQAGWERLLPAGARRLLREGALPRRRERAVAVLFADIEGCTRLCEDLPPLEMNEVIERYFSAYLDIVGPNQTRRDLEHG